MRTFGLLITVALLGTALASAAAAARQPTPSEVRSVYAALPKFIRAVPLKCVRFGITVSNSGRYAKVVPVFLNATKQPCVKYAANGYWLLRKASGWKIVFNGSDPPPCSLGIPADLSKCIRS
jgi:hypothetical protein